MLDIASQSDVDTRSDIQYKIHGIPDHSTNKAKLYGAKNIRQLKEKVLQYEAMKISEVKGKLKNNGHKDDQMTIINGKDDKKKKVIDGYKKQRRCFTCGASNHLNNTDLVEDKRIKFFKCNKHGHIASS